MMEEQRTSISSSSSHHPHPHPQSMAPPRRRSPQSTLVVLAAAAALVSSANAFLLPLSAAPSRSPPPLSSSPPASSRWLLAGLSDNDDFGGRSEVASAAAAASTSAFGGPSIGGGPNKAKPLDWLEEVRRKHYEVKQLQGSEEGRRLQAMLERVSPEGGYRVGRALKRSVGEPVHQVSVIAEIKRRTPTGGETPTEVAAISDVGLVACQLAECGADVLLVATDGPCYGGSVEDLRMARAALDTTKEDEAERPPLVAKDLYIHPLQIAQAVEAGADGVLLMTCLLGASLQEMLDTCSLLGTEALVEVHTVAELEKALELGATNIVATNWDRVENQLYPEQAKGLKFLIPDLIVAIAAGGIGTVQGAGELADMGYDAVVLGRGLASSPDIERLIRSIRTRESLPSLLTGAGYTAEELKRQRQAEAGGGGGGGDSGK